MNMIMNKNYYTQSGEPIRNPTAYAKSGAPLPTLF